MSVEAVARPRQVMACMTQHIAARTGAREALGSSSIPVPNGGPARSAAQHNHGGHLSLSPSQEVEHPSPVMSPDMQIPFSSVQLCHVHATCAPSAIRVHPPLASTRKVGPPGFTVSLLSTKHMRHPAALCGCRQGPSGPAEAQGG